MVWGLFPADPLSGEEKYYVFSKGTYRVGRKGCDVIISKEKGVSRIHAEMVIDEMTLLDHQQKTSKNISLKVRIKDCSKYGTFINKNLGSKEKVHEFPNKETTLNDGDLVTFGTGNAAYRFCSVPLVFFICCSEALQANELLLDKISSMGACTTHNWSPECTHVLVDDIMPLNEDLVDAIVSKKPFVCYNWVEFLAEKNICTEIPSCSFYAPTIMLNGMSVKVADFKTRENCLRGYTFLLDLVHKYKLKGRLQSLLEATGAKVASTEGFCPSGQAMEDEGNGNVLLVIPAGLEDGTEYLHDFKGLPRVNEINLICAALSGHLDPSVIASAPVLVTSSCSTDETVVVDSDAELEAATSVHASAAVDAIESIEHEGKGGVAVYTMDSDEHKDREKIAVRLIGPNELENKGGIALHTKEFIKHEIGREILINHADRSRSGYTICFRERNDSVTARKDKVDESENENSDIIFSQDLFTRDINFPTAVLNFKRFRKTRTRSGNSLNNLIPFSKYPYKDSDDGAVVIESAKEEKRRKQMEAIAEDLFNSEKGRKRSIAGTLSGLFSG